MANHSKARTKAEAKFKQTAKEERATDAAKAMFVQRRHG
jgi:hypothetical protein